MQKNNDTVAGLVAGKKKTFTSSGCSGRNVRSPHSLLALRFACDSIRDITTGRMRMGKDVQNRKTHDFDQLQLHKTCYGFRSEIIFVHILVFVHKNIIASYSLVFPSER